MKNKLTLIIISLILLISSTLIISICFLMNNENNLENQNNKMDVEYININDPSNPLFDYDPYLFSTLSGTDSGDGEYGVIINEINEDMNFVYNNNKIVYASPLYKGGEFDGVIGKGPDGSIYSNSFDNPGVIETHNVTDYTYDHEVFWYGGKLFFIGYHNNINVLDLTKNEFKQFDLYEAMGIPSNGTGSDDYKWMDNYHDELHTNSFDYYDGSIILSLRGFSALVSIRICDEYNNLMDVDDWYFEWYLPSDPTALYFMQSDLYGNNPYINIDGEIVKNEDYVPTFLESLRGKVISPVYNDKLYNLENNVDALEYESIDYTYKFFGQHKANILNPMLESNPSMIDYYDSDNIYVSIHDNHSAGADWNSFYIPHGNYNSVPDTKKDKSYTKILMINPYDMTYEVVMNYDNSTLSKNNMYASVRSNSTFFAIDGHFYLNTSSDKGRAVQIIEFEKINTIDGSLINPNLVFELKWEDSDWGNLYRSYPIFADINNIDYGWGLMELNRY